MQAWLPSESPALHERVQSASHYTEQLSSQESGSEGEPHPGLAAVAHHAAEGSGGLSNDSAGLCKELLASLTGSGALPAGHSTGQCHGSGVKMYYRLTGVPASLRPSRCT